MATRLVLGLLDVLGVRARVRVDSRRADAMELVRDNHHRCVGRRRPARLDPLAEQGLARELGRIARHTGRPDGG